MHNYEHAPGCGICESTTMKGILFSQMAPPHGQEAEFHDWYNTEHIPARLAIPGFVRARRFESIDGLRNYLAVYEIDDLEVFATPEFRALKDRPSLRTRSMLAGVSGFTRYICSTVSDRGNPAFGPVLSVNAFKVPAQHRQAFDDWYENEHIGRLLAGAGWLRVRRFAVTESDDDKWTHFALHELASRSVMDSPEREHARSGPKRDALAKNEWFNTSGRWLYRTIFDSDRK